MKRQPKLVHLTHHSCLANELGVDGVYERMYDESNERYRKDRYQQAYGDYARHLASWGHLHCRYASKTSLLTTELADVTCTTCLRAVENESRESLFDCASRPGIVDSDKRWYEKRAEAWCPDEELRIRAWIICCRHVGAPCPVSRQQAVKHIREARAKAAEWNVKLAVLSTFSWMGESAERLEKALAKVHPADRKLLHGVIEQARRADALAKKSAAIHKSIEQLAERAAKRIRRSAVVEFPTRAA